MRENAEVVDNQTTKNPPPWLLPNRKRLPERDSSDYEILSRCCKTRIVQTIKLGEAVYRNDVSTVEQLLSQGVNCDFRAGDRPAAMPQGIGHYCDFYDPTFPKEFISPLIYAIIGRDVRLVDLLLKSGADPNASFHDLYRPRWLPAEDTTIHCGRAVQLAAVLGLTEITRSLVGAGGRWDLPQVNREHHQCAGVDRRTWFSMLKRLEAASIEK
jgi:hypothetical protein